MDVCLYTTPKGKVCGRHTNVCTVQSHAKWRIRVIRTPVTTTEFDEAFSDQTYHTMHPVFDPDDEDEQDTWILEYIHTKYLALHAKLWVGITSYETDPKEGCRARWNAKYKKLGLDTMELLWISEDHTDCEDFESYLIKGLKEMGIKLDNLDDHIKPRTFGDRINEKISALYIAYEN